MNKFSRFFDISVSRNSLTKSIWDIRVFDFFNCASTWDSTDVSASIYDRKMDTRPFDTIHDILRCISLVQSLFEDRNAPIWRKREPTHMKLLRTDRLKQRPRTNSYILARFPSNSPYRARWQHRKERRPFPNNRGRPGPTARWKTTERWKWAKTGARKRWDLRLAGKKDQKTRKHDYRGKW